MGRLKAHLVVKGYSKKYGSDYYNTFSLVANNGLCSLASLYSRYAFLAPLSLDIKNLFLHGNLAEEAYKKQPSCFVAHR